MNIRTLVTAFAVSLTLFASATGTAHEHKKMIKVGDLIISGVWARTTPPTAKTGAAYFRVQNTGKTDDILIGVKGAISKKTEIHESKMEGGIMKMSHVGRVAVPAGGTAQLKPGSFHIMLMGLHGPIKEGDHFPLMLTFEKSGDVEVMVPATKSMKKDKKDHGKMGTN